MGLSGDRVLERSLTRLIIVKAFQGASSGKTEADDVDLPKIDKKSSKPGDGSKFKIIAGVLCFALLIISGLVLLATRFSFLKVDLAGVPVTRSTSRESIKASLENKIKDYKIYIVEPKATKEYPLSKTGVSIDIERSIDEALSMQKSSNLLPRLAFWQTHHADLKVEIDKKPFDAFVDKSMTVAVKPVQNASISINNGIVKINSEKAGSGYTITDPQSTLISAVAKMDRSPITLLLLPLTPSIKKENTKPAADVARAILEKKIIFNIAYTQVQATPADIGKWIEFSPVKSDKSIDVSINSGRVLEYLDDIAAPYVTPPRNAILLPGSAGTLIPGQNGIDIVNKEKLSAEVATKILSEKSLTATLPVEYQTYKTITATPHNKWLAVDLTSKRMYAYEKTKLVKTFLISGGAPQTPTVEGTYKIYSKYASQNMRGANADGSRYFQPNVQWVNYFYADYAIHGNYWRPVSYFGNINSSHGCIGVTNSDGQWIYNWAPIGTTVITFG